MRQSALASAESTSWSLSLGNTSRPHRPHRPAKASLARPEPPGHRPGSLRRDRKDGPVTAILPRPAGPATRCRSVPARASVWRLIAYWTPLALILVVQAFQFRRRPPGPSAPSSTSPTTPAPTSSALNRLDRPRIPHYETYYSGAPVIFSPWQASPTASEACLAVRLLCLCFELTKDGVSSATTRRLLELSRSRRTMLDCRLEAYLLRLGRTHARPHELSRPAMVLSRFPRAAHPAAA